jgi:hypothetical protein
MTVILLLAVGPVLWLAGASQAAPIGTAFTYQGRLVDDGRAADGQYDFRFRLYDDVDPGAGDQKGTTLYAGEVDVVDGYFMVELDFGNDPNVLSGHQLWLDIGVRPGEQEDPNIYTTLSPRQPVMPAPYALQIRGLHVSSIGSIGIGTDSPQAKLEVRGDVSIVDTGYVLTDEFDFWEDQSSHSYATTGTCKHGAYTCGDDDSLRIGDGLTDSGSVQITVSVTPNAATVKLRYMVPWAGGTGGALYVDGVNKGLIDDNGCNWQEKLLTDMSAYTADGLLEMEIVDEVAGNDGDVQITYMEVYCPTTSGLDVVGDANISDDLTVGDRVGIGTATPGYKFHQIGADHVIEDSDIVLRRANRHRWRLVEDAGTGLSIKQVYNDSGALQNAVRMEIADDGEVGLGTTAPAAKLHVEESGSADPLRVRVSGSTKFMVMNSGRVGIGTYSPISDLHVLGDPNIGSVTIGPAETGSGDDSELNLSEDTDHTYGMSIKYDGGDNKMYFYGKSAATIYGPHLTIMRDSGNVGIGTDSPAEELTVRGNILLLSKSTGNTVMELGEGLDYAEGFDVSSSAQVAAGCVLVIDSENPGKLALSTQSYDKRVAGIVAGANGLSSAIRLGAGEFDYDVALAGRVYCNIDATDAGIEPGDLLTTSAIPGCAMKATDYIRAQGAILGKAMQRLEKGQKGQILVLVTLQ